MTFRRCIFCRADSIHIMGVCMLCPLNPVEIQTPEGLLNIIRENDGQLAFDFDEDFEGANLNKESEVV